jgi:ribosomal protein S18 acetylase RimI-like enzyme
MDAISLRPEEPDDEAFLAELYASTRAEEMELMPWAATQKQAFLLAQFRLQAAHYRSHYPGAEFHIVLHENRSIGRLYVHRGTSEIRLMDITLIPEYRGRGFGRKLLQPVLDIGMAVGKPITAYVDRNNPARRLYERLGFRVVMDNGVYLFLECST